MSGICSKMAAPPLDTIKAIKPQARVPATAEETATRQAIFENGSNLVNTPAHKVQSGNPGGDDTPPYAAAVDQTPELSKPTDGPSVRR